MENQAPPNLLNLFSERLLVTGALDLLNEALTQATLFLEKCLICSNQQEPNSLPCIPKVKFLFNFSNIFLNSFQILI